MLKNQMQNEVEALKQHRLLHQKKKKSITTIWKCLIILIEQLIRCGKTRVLFSFFFLSNYGSVKPVCGPYDTRHLHAKPLLVEEEVSSTKNVSSLSFLLLMLPRGIMSQLCCGFLECLFTALLMIAGLLVTDWQPWAGCTRSHLTGLSLTISSCSSPSASSGIHPLPPKHLICTLTCWIAQVLFSRTSTRTGTRTRTGTS